MRSIFSVLTLFVTLLGFSQTTTQEIPRKSLIKSAEQKAKELAMKAPVTSYRIITLVKDTTYVDTSLTIKKEYEFNYLRKDNFGLLPFANEGQPYARLQYGLSSNSPYPEIGYQAKHSNYLDYKEVKYYSVATPLTELYIKTAIEQGQTSDAFFTLNTSKRFNFSVAYKGLRSLGKYINQLSSTGNFRFTTSYNSKNKRYFANFHFTSQDFLNGENGGITTTENFENKSDNFIERQRLEVYLKDAKSYLKGRRTFLDHKLQINPTFGANNFYVTHQFNYENKFFEYNQLTVSSTVGDISVNRFGSSFVTSGINDQLHYNRMYNKVGILFENKTCGNFHFYLEDFRYNYYYKSVFVVSNLSIPSSLNDKINSFGGQYEFQKSNWKGSLLYSNAISNQSLSNIDVNFKYNFKNQTTISLQFQSLTKLPNHIYNLHQSSYLSYIWHNDFKNQKINTLQIHAASKWFNASLQATTFRDYLYFQNTSTNDTVQLVSPKQDDNTINLISFKVNKEIKFWKFALDNTLLYQKVGQTSNILNVPQFVTRNTFYYTNYYFKKALFLQTGVTFNYFTKYLADDYNPILAEFFVQNKKQIGDFANFDFFINARIRQTRFFLKAEHFNSSFNTTNTFYTAPNYPYRDFVIRFGLVWTFFQ